LNESDSGHLGFLARIPVPLKIWLGTVAEIYLCIFSMICANFGAFNTKHTILMIFDTNLLHYLQSATRPVQDLKVFDNNSINVSSYRLQNYHTMILDDIIEANIYRHFRGPRANAEICGGSCVPY